MTDEEANKLSDCGYGCHIIGGPWISYNPQCPEHGDEARARMKEAPAQGDAEPVAWRWRPRGATNWIYNPSLEWLDAQGDDIEKQPLYAGPPAKAAQLARDHGFEPCPACHGEGIATKPHGERVLLMRDPEGSPLWWQSTLDSPPAQRLGFAYRYATLDSEEA